MKDAETIEGYEVRSSVRIGHKRLIFAVHPDEAEEYPYLKCTEITDGMLVRYKDALASTDCLEALQLFADDIKSIEQIEKGITAQLRNVLGIGAKVHLVNPRSIERSEGKARRVIDRRKL